MLTTIKGIPVWGEVTEYGAIEQAITCRRTADHVALMADHHLGYAVPIGGVVAYRDAVSPSGVGFDIGCGNKAVRLDADPVDVRRRIGSIMDDVVRTISFGVGRNNDTPVEHEMFERDGDPGWELEACKPLKRMAANQLGTVGGGNHYVDVFVDELQRVWVGCHFGSRGLGHKTATWFLKAGGARDGMNVAPLVLPMESRLAQDYVVAMRLAGRYAYAGRDWVCAQVAKIIGARVVEEVHNHHNFAWRERHEGEDYWVVRKGATPAFPGQRGFVGATMAEYSVVVEGLGGVETETRLEQLAAMFSTVHGAGRAMSRTAAKGKTHRKTGEVITAGMITREQMDAQISVAGVELRGGDVDEAPGAYKRLGEVLAHHSNTVRVVHVLQPIGVAMAARGVHDPFKD